MLAAAQIAQFKTQGYTTAPGFFTSDEVVALKAEVDRWFRVGALRNVATESDGSSPSSQGANLQLVPLDVHSDVYRALPFHPKVVAAVSDLIGDPVAKILDQLFYKPARVGLGTNWHTDNAYFKLGDPLKGTAMWIALDDATKENGTLKVIPGRFREVFPHERDPDSDHHIRYYPDESEAIHCELEAGGVVFFCFGTPHATGPNHSSQARTGVGVHFINSTLTEGSEPRWKEVHLTGPRATQGVREYGLEIEW